MAAASFSARCLGVSPVADTARAAASAEEDACDEDVCARAAEDRSPVAHAVTARATEAAASAAPSGFQSGDLMPTWTPGEVPWFRVRRARYPRS
jgi:hypothetical protein